MTPPPACRSLSRVPEPGYLYRVGKNASPTDPARGVYARNATYYDEALPGVQKSTLAFINKRSHKNALAARFFAVWGIDSESDGTYKQVQVVSVPVRSQYPDGQMFQTTASKTKLRAQMVWVTGHGTDQFESAGPRRFQVSYCRGQHTETRAKAFLDRSEVQTALWNLMMHQAREDDLPTDARLELMGISFYSRNDACDHCLDTLTGLNNSGLPALLPAGSSVLRLNTPVAFTVRFEAKNRYNPGLCNFGGGTHNGCYSATICAIPRPRLLRLAETDEDGKTAVHPWDKNEKVEHVDEVRLEEGENPTFVIFTVAGGTPYTLSLAG